MVSDCGSMTKTLYPMKNRYFKVAQYNNPYKISNENHNNKIICHMITKMNKPT